MKVCDIQIKLYYHNTGCGWKAPNIFLWSDFESDFIAVTKAGYIREFEIKLSLSDFYNDAKKANYQGKTKYDWLLEGLGPAEFSYVFPKGLIPYDKIPGFAGIIEVVEFDRFDKTYLQFITIRGPKRLNNKKITDGQIKTLCTSLYYRYWDLQHIRHKERQGELLML